MHVSRLMIENFRSLKELVITFQPGTNVIVGKNNSGKSSIVQALDIVLGEKSPLYREIGTKDYLCNTVNGVNEYAEDMTIVVKLEGSEVNKSVFASRNKKTKVYTCPDKEFFIRDTHNILSAEQDLKFQWLDPQQLLEWVEKSTQKYLYFYSPRERDKEERIFCLVFEYQRERRILNYMSIEMRDALITTAYIPSFRDPSLQLRINDYSWYGKLIRKIYESRSDFHIENIASSHALLSETLNEIFTNATMNLKKMLREAIFHNEISFRANTNTKDDEHKQIMLFVNDGIDAPYYEKGSGIQSALILSLFTYYCEIFHKGNTLLLAEEPEIYLHPQAKRSIEGKLSSFTIQAPDTIYARQVILTTHAPEFLQTVPLNAVSCVRKDQVENCSKVYQISPKTTSDQLVRWRQILSTKNSEMLFADYVILVEGGEEFLLPALFDLYFETSHWLDTHNISVIRVDGKSRFIEYVNILNEFEIKYLIITDFDFLKDSVQSFITLHSINQTDRRYVDKVRDRIRTLSTPNVKGSKVKDSLAPEVKDWVRIYSQVEDTVNSLTDGSPVDESTLREISALWNRLSDRIMKRNLSNLFDETDEDMKICFSVLRERNIFVLKKGDLEDYLTPKALELEKSKDRRALLVGHQLRECENFIEATEWMITHEFTEIIDRVRTDMNL